MRNKLSVFLFVASIIIAGIYGSTIATQSSQAESKAAKGLTVTAPTFEVTFEQTQYTLVQPFQRDVNIWVTVKNRGDTADKINFFLPANTPKGWNIHGGGYIYLGPGETGRHEVAVAWPSGDKEIVSSKLEISARSEANPASSTSATINISYADFGLKDAPLSSITVNVYDAATKSPINNASVYYRIESRYEEVRQEGEGKFRIQVPSYQALSKFAKKQGLSWSGYHIEAHAAGYQSYYEDELKPKEDVGLTQDVYLTPLTESANFQAAWVEKLDYPGVWRVVPSENGDYFAVAMGKHPDPGDTMGPTKVHFFSSTKGLLWSYPVGGHVWGIDINQDGSLVAAGSHDGRISVIDRSGKQVWSYDARTNLREVKFSDTGAYIGAETSPIKIFSADNGKVVWEYRDPAQPWWRGITFSQDDKYVVYAGGNSVMLLDVENRKPLWHKYTAGVPYDVMLTPDLSRIVVADKGDSLSSYDRQGSLLWRHSDLDVLTDADMSRDGSRIVALSHDGTVRMYDGDGKLLWRRAVGSGGHNGIDMTADGKYIAVGGGTIDSPYKVFLLDGDGNLLWQHSQPGPVSTAAHPYTISAMSVAIADDASYIVAGYGTSNPGVQLFKGKVSSGSEAKKETRPEEILNKYVVASVAGLGIIIFGTIIFFVIRFVRRRRIRKPEPQA